MQKTVKRLRKHCSATNHLKVEYTGYKINRYIYIISYSRSRISLLLNESNAKPRMSASITKIFYNRCDITGFYSMSGFIAFVTEIYKHTIAS